MTIASMTQQGFSMRSMAWTLSRSAPTPSCISHEAKCPAICILPRGKPHRQLIAIPRHGHGHANAAYAGRAGRRGRFPDMANIHMRLAEVEDRVMLGHREGDFIRPSLDVLVERVMRRVLHLKNAAGAAVSALRGFPSKSLPCATHGFQRPWRG